jgi:hypothetical protein
LTYVRLIEFGSWLVTNEKVENCRLLSEMLCVPFFGFLYLVPDRKAMLWQITDLEGNFLFPFEVKETLTKETINGGEVLRANAFLSIKYAKEL